MFETETTQELQGKAALVTGGSRGIGAAIARQLAARGANVAITYAANAPKAEDVVKEIESVGSRGLAIKADSADPRAITAAVNSAAKTFGGLDILVNNAGIFPYGPPEEVTIAEIDHTLDIHVKGVFVASQAALSHMGNGGRIISIGSCFATRVPFAGVTLYSMSKSALIGFTKGLARDVGPRGITVNVVDPGPTDTDMNPSDGPNADNSRALSSLGRYGAPDEIAAMVAYLAGPGGGYVTGASLAVDGGSNA
ncbi:3-oxoacyl-ACP reductase family protein [Nitratireductor sp. GISD-1A_MAKvit]|uniref:3-oxoacyl-ACP reductase family protein n=1 Tax=Nitratireductor sp. GISD-1A_MAKvit TaxID=3234198 RepID=UPI003466F94F